MNPLLIIAPETNAVTQEYQNDELYGQHDARTLNNGNVLVFANGVHHSDLNHSKTFEIDPARKEIVWRYRAKDDYTSFSHPIWEGCSGRHRATR